MPFVSLPLYHLCCPPFVYTFHFPLYSLYLLIQSYVFLFQFIYTFSSLFLLLRYRHISRRFSPIIFCDLPPPTCLVLPHSPLQHACSRNVLSIPNHILVLHNVSVPNTSSCNIFHTGAPTAVFSYRLFLGPNNNTVYLVLL